MSGSNPNDPASQCVIERISLLVAEKARQWRAFHARAFSAETVFPLAPPYSTSILRPTNKIFPFSEGSGRRSVRQH